MFSVEKGMNLQGGVSVAMVGTFVLKWVDVAYDAVFFTVSEPVNGFALALAFKLLLVALFCSLGSVWVSFTKDKGDSKDTLLGILAGAGLILALLTKWIHLPSGYDHKGMIGFYLYLVLCGVNMYLGYKVFQSGQENSEDATTNVE